MKSRLIVLASALLVSALAHAAGDPKKPVLLQGRDAKISNGLTRFSATGYGGVSVAGLVDKSGFIDFELKLEPGKYRLIVSMVPQGGGYLLAKVDDGQAVRRTIPRSAVYSYKPQEIRFGEIEVPKDAAKLRFTAENVAQPGIGYFYQAELLWVGPLPSISQVKSPLQQLAEKEKALKLAKLAKEAQELRDNLKGTTWSFCMNHDFEASGSALVFGTDGNIGLLGMTPRGFKVVDPRTIDIFYGSGTSFSRLRFSEDMGSFKSDLEEGIRQPRSGKLLKMLGAPGGRAALSGEAQRASSPETSPDKAKAATEGSAGSVLMVSLRGTSWNWYATRDFTGRAYQMSFNDDGTVGLPWNKRSLVKAVDARTIDVFYDQATFWRLRFSDDLTSFQSDLSAGKGEPKSGRRN